VEDDGAGRGWAGLGVVHVGLGAEGAWCLVKMLQYWGEARASWGGYMARWGVTGRGVAVWGRAGHGGAGVPRLGG